MIFEDDKMVFHTETNKKLTDEELKKYVDFYWEVILPDKLLPGVDESEAPNDKNAFELTKEKRAYTITERKEFLLFKNLK